MTMGDITIPEIIMSDPSGHLLDLIHADPGLPVPHPTTPMWQIPLHPLAQVSSSSLPKSSDIVVIGSGIAACSVTKGLLESDPNLRITVLEARSLCSGASSRNGGHITSPSFQDFHVLVKAWGVKTAVQIAQFTMDNVDKTFEAMKALDMPDLEDVSEIRRTQKVHAFRDEKTLGKFNEIVSLWDAHMPERRKGQYKILTAEEAKQQYGLQNVTGAVATPAAAVWPYRLWAGVWSYLLQKYPDRLNIETYTPALSVRAAPHAAHFKSRYLIATPKGEIEADKVVYATNAFTSHLLPNLRGRLYPLRGTMSAQDLGTQFPNRGNELSWQFYRERLVEPETAHLPGALYYLTQNAKTGHMFLGGETDKLETILSPDDSMLNGQSATELTKQLPDVFENAPTPGLRSIWSGIMGFTVDGLPLIGRVPQIVSGRPESGEYICAGFNGYGTGYCYMCGQAVAQMIIGKDALSWVPGVFFLTKERFEKSLDPVNWWPGLLEL